MKRTWYKKYIGYQFADGGILEDVFRFEDENGKPTSTAYQMYYPETGKRCIMDYKVFKEIAHQTCLPR